MANGTVLREPEGSALAIRPLTPGLWPALEELFGESGAVGGCWCMYCRIGRSHRDRRPADNKSAFKEIVMRGPPPGLIAFVGEPEVDSVPRFGEARPLAVGWCQLMRIPRRSTGRTSTGKPSPVHPLAVASPITEKSTSRLEEKRTRRSSSPPVAVASRKVRIGVPISASQPASSR